MLEINRDPTRRDLALFGVALAAFFGIVGGIVLWRTGSVAIPRVIWIAGAALVTLYLVAPPLRRPIFVGWQVLFYPLGWLLTHVVLAAIYFLLLTPAGLVMRLLGRDPMHRRFDSEATTYWVERPPPPPAKRYFRQF